MISCVVLLDLNHFRHDDRSFCLSRGKASILAYCVPPFALYFEFVFCSGSGTKSSTHFYCSLMIPSMSTIYLPGRRGTKEDIVWQQIATYLYQTGVQRFCALARYCKGRDGATHGDGHGHGQEDRDGLSEHGQFCRGE